MLLLDNTLWIEYKDFIAAGWKEDTLKKSNMRNGNNWITRRSPNDRRTLLVRYDSLIQPHKEKLKLYWRFLNNCKHDPGLPCQCTNPFQILAKQPIEAMVSLDPKAEIFYTNWKYDNGKNLHPELVKKYAIAASWLNMLIDANAVKKSLKKKLGLSIEEFWNHVAQIIISREIDLPSSYQRLRNKMAEYATEGYRCLIDWRLGNKFASKIGRSDTGFTHDQAEQQLALVRHLARLHNNYNAAQIHRLIEPIFKAKGWTMVSARTVRNIVDKSTHLTLSGSRGQQAYNNRIAMGVKRKAPSYPLRMWSIDGWTAELLFQDNTGYNNRLVIVVVLDVFNKYPVGYAIGRQENAELIRQANRNAITHIFELIGQYQRPWQIQSDRYAIKQNTTFYQSMANIYTPAAVGNAKAKPIEPYFKYLNNTYCQFQYNWSGHNVDAKKENQPNREFLNKIKKSLPYMAEVESQLQAIMQSERSKKRAEFIRAYDSIPVEERLVLSRENMLIIYGKKHTHTSTITGQGIIATIERVERVYDSFDPAFRALHHLTWQLWYMPGRPEQVMAVSECGKYRHLLEEKRVIPMSIKDAKSEDHEYLNRIGFFNKKRREEVISITASDADITRSLVAATPLSLDDINEATLKLMFTDKHGQQKDPIQKAKGLIAENTNHLDRADHLSESADWSKIQQQYLAAKTELNDYL
jgi:hypothetical protein